MLVDQTTHASARQEKTQSRAGTEALKEAILGSIKAIYRPGTIGRWFHVSAVRCENNPITDQEAHNNRQPPHPCASIVPKPNNFKFK